MKKLFLSLVALMIATVSYAQNSLIATLSHENGVQMFYGTSALANAVDVAVSGDVITLSGGSFESDNINITKGITIRGAGAEAGTPTTIKSRGMNISVPSEDNNRVVIEGAVVGYSTSYNINISSGNLYIIKCIFISKPTFSASSTADAKFVNCNIQYGLTLNGASNIKMSNCRVGSDIINNSTATSSAKFFNCYLFTGSSTNLNSSSLVNCMLYSTDIYSNPRFSSNASAMNCIFVDHGFAGATLPTNAIDCYLAKVPEVFASYENKEVDRRYGVYRNVPTTDKLSDEAKTKYLGTDGTEVGLYGGQYPYDLTPLYPQITKLNVAKQATADNKLSVEVEVSANE